MRIKLFILISFLSYSYLKAEYWGKTYYLNVNIILKNTLSYTGYLNGIVFDNQYNENQFLHFIDSTRNITSLILTVNQRNSKIAINPRVFNSGLGGLMFPKDTYIEIDISTIDQIELSTIESQDDLGCIYLTEANKDNIKLLNSFRSIKTEQLDLDGVEYYYFYFNKIDFELEMEVFQIQKDILEGKNTSSIDFQKLLEKGVIVRTCYTD